ncbi:MAG TPA: nucleoside monophosphate kinase [Candidatus Paceibacterota bacterium]
METKTIFFVGKPGCGKGTQAKLLGEETGWPIFISGALFRALEAEDTPVGRRLKKENEAGFLSPHWFAMYLYLKSLFAIPEGASAIFDGFNRKIEEAELNISSLAWLGRPFTVINVIISDEEVGRRLEGRRKVSGRADDHAVEERLKEYYEFTVKAIALFRDVGALIDIDGERSVEAIAVDIKKALELPPREDSGPAA